MAKLKRIVRNGKSSTRVASSNGTQQVVLNTPRIGNDINPALKPKYCRTKLANGSAVFPGIDKRTWFGRHIHDMYFSILEDKGGRNNVSTMEDALIRQLVSLVTTGEIMSRNKAIEEHCYEEGLTLPDDHRPYDYLEHLTLVRTCASVGKQIGLKREPKKVEQEETLEDFLKSKTRRKRRPDVIDTDYEDVSS